VAFAIIWEKGLSLRPGDGGKCPDSGLSVKEVPIGFAEGPNTISYIYY
jgi:hypothetical protein